MKMKQKKIISLGVLILLIFLGCSKISPTEEKKQPTFASKTSDGEVSITLTPTYEDGTLVVQYALNTHSVDMSSFDLQQQVVLQSNGQTYYATNKPILSGHHNNGNLHFKISPLLTSFEIITTDIPDVKERRLSWP